MNIADEFTLIEILKWVNILVTPAYDYDRREWAEVNSQDDGGGSSGGVSYTSMIILKLKLYFLRFVLV
jgi:hypothetical protein